MPAITTPRAFPFLVLGTALLVSLDGMGRPPLYNVAVETGSRFSCQ